MDTSVFFFISSAARQSHLTNMRSAAKAWSPITKAGTHGIDRTRPLPAASSGMKSSKSSTSLAFESQLSKVSAETRRARKLGVQQPARED